MLPPHELKNKSFSRAMRGYNSVEVDEYIDFIIEKYTELYRENDELEHKLKATVARLEEIKNDEDSIRGALIDAKRAAAKIKAEAEERAEAIIRSAKSSCNTILQDFNRKIEEGRDTLIEIKRDTQELKSELFERYSEHIRFLDKLTDGIEMDDIPDTAALRRSAVNSLKASIAEAYAPSDTDEPSDSTDNDNNGSNKNADGVNNTDNIDNDDIDSAVGGQSADNGAQDAVESQASKNNNEDDTESSDEISFMPESDEPALDDTVVFNPADVKATDDNQPSGDGGTIVFDKIPSETDGSDEPTLNVNREPLETKPPKSGLKDSVKELNKRYRESDDVINTPDSDIDDDSYLDFVKTVTGKDDAKKDESNDDADFDMLFNDTKKKKKK